MSEPRDTPIHDELFDAGAQSERTALAWQRTGLSAIAVGALLVHIPPHQPVLSFVPGALLIIAGILSAAVLAPLRYRRILWALQARRSPTESRTILLFCALMSIVVVMAGFLVVLG